MSGSDLALNRLHPCPTRPEARPFAATPGRAADDQIGDNCHLESDRSIKIVGELSSDRCHRTRVTIGVTGVSGFQAVEQAPHGARAP
jgi:hypothetical protein